MAISEAETSANCRQLPLLDEPDKIERLEAVVGHSLCHPALEVLHRGGGQHGDTPSLGRQPLPAGNGGGSAQNGPNEPLPPRRAPARRLPTPGQRHRRLGPLSAAQHLSAGAATAGVKSWRSRATLMMNMEPDP